MPDQRYDASRQTVGTLLSTTSPRLEVPDWQRSYSWGSDEIEAFWLDLLAFEANYPGTNILGEEYFLGSTVLVTGGTTNLVLDGQQRLATATILLSALRDARRGYNANAAVRLQNKYIADFDDATETTTPVLTLNVYDREYFRAEVQDEATPERPRPAATLKSHGLVRKARTYFAERLAEESDRAGGGQSAFERNLRLGQVLCDHMSVVVVSSTDEDNAAAVFETLNDRGIGLSTPDLLRNLLMRRASNQDVRDRIVAAWQTVLSIADEASVDEFLRHFWVSNHGDVKSRKLYREIKDTILRDSLDPLQLSLELADAAPVYRDIARAQSSDPELRRLLEGLRTLGAKVTYPMLLSGYSVAVDESSEELRDLARALTTLFVRYNVIGGRESTTLEATVYEAAAGLRDTGDFSDAIAALQALSPDGSDFIRRFGRASVSRIATARYLLREIEYEKRRTGELSVESPDRVHVEHIYPQTPAGAKWPNHTQMINRLGNLTLLGRSLNTSINIVLTSELMSISSWTPAAVNARQVELSQWVFKIWKFPDEKSPSPEPLTSDSPDIDDQFASIEELPETPA
jgi:hypothetical protein